MGWNTSETLGNTCAAAGRAVSASSAAVISFFMACPLLRWRMADIPVHPLDEPFHVRRIGMAAVMLAPGELSVQHGDIHRRHLGDVIIADVADALGAQQGPGRLCGDGGHVAAL